MKTSLRFAILSSLTLAVLSSWARYRPTNWDSLPTIPTSSSEDLKANTVYKVDGNISRSSGLHVPDNSTVTIYFARGSTVNVDASGQACSAGIQLPPTSTLILRSADDQGGTLSVKGGNGRTSESGRKGEDGDYAKGFAPGGDGGRGSDGGGAAIGGAGGFGGGGGSGGPSRYGESTAYRTGKPGDNGAAGTGCGRVFVFDGIKLSLVGGSGGNSSQGGAGGDNSMWGYAGGGGGGGGGQGGTGALIGGGGGGAGGGGGGGGGDGSKNGGGGGGGGAHWGKGGNGGAKDGNRGGDSSSDVSLTGGSGGSYRGASGYGGKGGDGGAGGAGGQLVSYTDLGLKQTTYEGDGRVASTADGRKITFEMNCSGVTSTDHDTYTLAIGTAVAIVSVKTPTRSGWGFEGYFTSATNGVRVFDTEGTSIVQSIDANVTNLYARWHQDHCVCGANDCTNHGGSVSWQPTETLPTKAGDYFLVKDITVTAGWTPPEGVRLCLNGHTVTASGDTRILSLGEQRHLTVTDCGTTGALQNGKCTTTGEIGGCVLVKGGILTLYRGAIAGGHALDGGGVGVQDGGSVLHYGGEIRSCSASYRGGGVSVSGSTSSYRLLGGVIRDNVSRLSGGGIHVLEGGTFEMSGGEIVSNKSTNDIGGGVQIGGKAVVTMTGGRIACNTAPRGGGVAMWGGTFNLNGGVVETNTASLYGGAVYLPEGANANAFNMKGGLLVGNTAQAGGGVFIGKGTFTLDDGEILYNVSQDSSGAETYGGGVCAGMTSEALFVMRGGRLVANYAYRGAGVCVMTNATATIYGGRIEANPTGRELMAVSGSGKINLYGGVFDKKPEIDPVTGYVRHSVDASTYWTVGRTNTVASAHGYLTGGVYTYNPSLPLYADTKIYSAASTYVVKTSGDIESWKVTPQGVVSCETWPSIRSNLIAGNDVKLASDMYADVNEGAVAITTKVHPHLDLNGRRLDTEIASSLFVIDADGAALDVTGDGTVAYIQDAPTSMHHGGCFSVKNGTLLISGGAYQNFRLQYGYDGGCVYVGEKGVFKMTGGTIFNCSAGCGGAIASNGSLIFENGTLAYNFGTFGGGISVTNGTALIVTGTFEENFSSCLGGAIAACGEVKELSIMGGYYINNRISGYDGNGPAVYLDLGLAGKAKLRGGLFGPNLVGGSNQEPNIVAVMETSTDQFDVSGGFFHGTTATALLPFLRKGYERVAAVRTDGFGNWDVVALADTVKVANNRVEEGTFSFDPKGDPCYVALSLVPNGARTVHTPASGENLETWQLTGVEEESLYFEGRCLINVGMEPIRAVTGMQMLLTYLTTTNAADIHTSSTNYVAVQFDEKGYYASQTSLDVCKFIKEHGHAALAIDVWSLDCSTLIVQEPRQLIGYVPYAVHADCVETVSADKAAVETLNVTQQAAVKKLTVTDSLTVRNKTVVTNLVEGFDRKIEGVTIDRLTLAGAGTSLLGPVGEMPLAFASRKDWNWLSVNGRPELQYGEGKVSVTVKAENDGILFVACAAFGGGKIELILTRLGSGDGGGEELFHQNGCVSTDDKGYDLSYPVRKGESIRITGSVDVKGSAKVGYRFVGFGNSQEEK